MISKHITCKPKHDNYRRLANYIAGKTQNRGIEFDERPPYIQEPYPRESGDLAEHRLRRLSECNLVYREAENGRESEGILSIDARSYNERNAFLRRNSDHSTGEKCLLSWTAGCWTEGDYEGAIQEVISTQAMNTRSQKAKTYHLIVSFRPEDREKLTEDVFKEIERRFASTLVVYKF